MEITIDLTIEQISELMRTKPGRDPLVHLKFVNALMIGEPHYHNPTEYGPRMIPKSWKVEITSTGAVVTLGDLVASRKAIPAIKCLRSNIAGLGLKQAKDIYDGIINNL